VNTGNPVGQKPCFPFAVRADHLGIEQIDSGVTDRTDLERFPKMVGPKIHGGFIGEILPVRNFVSWAIA
jgi:hypothetical protein